jgi:hypothetical protein
VDVVRGPHRSVNPVDVAASGAHGGCGGVVVVVAVVDVGDVVGDEGSSSN